VGFCRVRKLNTSHCLLKFKVESEEKGSMGDTQNATIVGRWHLQRL
jgi:hypothetical protein